MAYAALQELGLKSCTNIIAARSKAGANAGQGVLILDVPLGTQLTNFYAYRAQWEYLYGQLVKAAPSEGGRSALSTSDLSSYAAPLVSLLGLLKNGVTYSAQSFQANSAPLIQALVKTEGCKTFVQLSSVTHLDVAEKDISQQLQDLDTAHTNAKLRSDSALEALYQNFLKWLTTSSANGGSVLSDAISGDAIITAVCGDAVCRSGFDTLQLTIDAAGGNIRQNNFFLLNFFYTPQPSFNSGVEISWSLFDPANHYLGGETLKRTYGYSKWHPKKFTWGTDASGNGVETVNK